MEEEGEKIPNTGTKKLYCSESVRMGIGNKKLIYTPPPQDCVESKKENKIIQLNYDRYDKNGRGTTRRLNVMAMATPRRSY